MWSDEDYRDLLLAYPRNCGPRTRSASPSRLVPGVRQVLVKDLYGGLDITPVDLRQLQLHRAALLRGAVARLALLLHDFGRQGRGGDLVRPRAAQGAGRGGGSTGCGRSASSPASSRRPRWRCRSPATSTVEGLPIPAGTPTAVNDSLEAQALKQRILDRIRRYVSALRIAEPVRYAEVFWAVMEEPGVVDCTNLRLRRFPARVGATSTVVEGGSVHEVMSCEQDLVVGESEVTRPRRGPRSAEGDPMARLMDADLVGPVTGNLTLPFGAASGAGRRRWPATASRVTTSQRHPVVLLRLRRSLVDERVIVHARLGGDDLAPVVFAPFSLQGIDVAGVRTGDHRRRVRPVRGATGAGAPPGGRRRVRPTYPAAGVLGDADVADLIEARRIDRRASASSC